MSSFRPDLLFRCCSDSSVGRLESGKSLLGLSGQPLSNRRLLAEFETHSRPWEETPTALVSTTVNFLRVIHLAFHKLWNGEDAQRIELIFILPDADDDVQFHCAKDLALQLAWSDSESQHFQHEYLFEWQIPNNTVLHRITLDILMRRGFTLHHLCGQAAFDDFPDMMSFQKLIRGHWEGLCMFDRGYKAGSTACRFGFHSLTGRLADEIVGLTVRRHRYTLIQRGVADALDSYACDIGEGLMNYKAELGDVSETAALLYYDYATEVTEVTYNYLKGPEQLDRELALLEDRYQVHRDALQRRVTEIYREIGY